MLQGRRARVAALRAEPAQAYRARAEAPGPVRAARFWATVEKRKGELWALLSEAVRN